ncbi:MAG: GNAT family N-acetyltransferase [Planctomycetes bacterium]|nr:GNAT family N-acetyltransferase [Planctomycetota bacterium]
MSEAPAPPESPASDPAGHDPHRLPPGLPVPADDGAALHLARALLPALDLPATDGARVGLHRLGGPTIFFFYPRTGIPGQPPALGFAGETWESIPGARGCTPQSCGFRDLAAEFIALGVRVFGVSTNTTEHQREFKERNHVPFEFLSDAALSLTRSLHLPTFEFPVESGGPSTLLKRLAFFAEPESPVGADPVGGGRPGAPGPDPARPARARIRKVWYPVYPPEGNAATVLAWIRGQRAIGIEPVQPGDLPYVQATLKQHWLSSSIWSRGRRLEADRLPGFVARHEGRAAGLITLHIESATCEFVTLSSDREDCGIGEALVEAGIAEARRRGCRRVFLTTGNDNLRALRFYQRRGFVLVSIHRRMLDRYRERHLKALPLLGANGIPLRDEIELECMLD